MAKLSDAMRRLADELDADDKKELEAATAERIDRLEAAQTRGGLSEEQADTLARARALLDELDKDPPDDRGGAPGGSGDDDDGGGGDGDEPPPSRRTAKRPGRKRGQAYDYDVDEKGRPVKLGTAKVYGGDDEPDEIEYELDADDDE